MVKEIWIKDFYKVLFELQIWSLLWIQVESLKLLKRKDFLFAYFFKLFILKYLHFYFLDYIIF